MFFTPYNIFGMVLLCKKVFVKVQVYVKNYEL